MFHRRDQRAAGIITVAWKDSRVKFLVLQASNHKAWSCPKGYLDVDENEYECAEREFFEETGCPISHPSLQMLERKEYMTAYKAWGGYKRVVWYVAFCKDPEKLAIQLSPEHSDYQWITAEEYRILHPTFDTMHEVFASVERDFMDWGGESNLIV